jgi:hypothetical protein
LDGEYSVGKYNFISCAIAFFLSLSGTLVVVLSSCELPDANWAQMGVGCIAFDEPGGVVFSLSLDAVCPPALFFDTLPRVLFVKTEVKLVDDFDFFGVSFSFEAVRELLDLGLAGSSAASSLLFPVDRREMVLSVFLCNDFGRSGEDPFVRRGGELLVLFISPRTRPASGWFGGSIGVLPARNGLYIGVFSFDWPRDGVLSIVWVRLSDLDDGIIDFKTEADLLRRCCGRSATGVEIILEDTKRGDVAITVILK